MATDVGADETVVPDLMASQDDRVRSYERIAEVFELTANGHA